MSETQVSEPTQAAQAGITAHTEVEANDTTIAYTHARGLAPWQSQFIEAFLAALREKPIITHAVKEACAAAGQGISRNTAYLWREKDEAFRKAWDEALEQGWDRAEGAAFERGVEGVEEPIFNKHGEQVGTKRVYSDRLLELLLKGNRGDKYREKTGPLVSINLPAADGAMERALNGPLGELLRLKSSENGGNLVD